MHGALQSDSWVSLAGGLILACHLCLLPAIGRGGWGEAGGCRWGPRPNSNLVGGGGAAWERAREEPGCFPLGA